MGPIPLALRQLLEVELYRSLQAEAMVGYDGVAGEQGQWWRAVVCGFACFARAEQRFEAAGG